MKKYLRLQTVGDDECLYHYTHGSSLMNILRTEKLYATKSSFLNDTNELDYITRVAADVIGEIERPEWRQILMRQIIDTMEEVKRHDTFVLSFSTDRDSITLWAEFGEETGYNVGFGGRELIRRIGSNQEIYCHGRVIYDTDRQRKMIRHLLTEEFPARTGKTFEELMEAEAASPGTDEFGRLRTRLQKALNIYAMFFKQAEFAPENEYRVAFRNPDRRRICFREKDGFLLPYIEIDLSGSGCLPVMRVTVAPKNHVDLAKKGMVQYLAHMNIKAEVALSELKLRY
ncbi:MAG: DUF2971 domain-containing protein [Lachnospiraceae bacterium]|nr:DUF2971 domain-containing protein [Lachnospiraceae bacterium]MCH4063252.1 DUF2971 domain-containing protein [Lachnospiraceae bacterium]MCH4105075.1 DUF2971 domain-containing protein [Lachnospiraceae bacterium]MCI1308533.1 DUF2971 domain-containing protein [Lachnospiraceae bacterium]MCI1333069.1 DUF2971 domain-containing protein [Lachnospiraceae bacterium]